MHGRFNSGLTQAVKQRQGPPLHVVRAFAWGGEGPRQLRGFGRGLLLRHVLQRRHHLVQHFRQLGRTQPLHRDKRGRQSGRVGDNSCSDLFDLSGCFAMRSTEPALKFPERFVKRRPIHARSWCARLGQTRRMHRSKLHLSDRRTRHEVAGDVTGSLPRAPFRRILTPRASAPLPRLRISRVFVTAFFLKQSWPSRTHCFPSSVIARS